jgi:hypothetical protein
MTTGTFEQCKYWDRVDEIRSSRLSSSKDSDRSMNFVVIPCGHCDRCLGDDLYVRTDNS